MINLIGNILACSLLLLVFASVSYSSYTGLQQVYYRNLFSLNIELVRIADRSGLMNGSEVSVYWTFNWVNEAAFEKARPQLTANILKNQNIIWKLTASLTYAANVSIEHNQFNKILTQPTHPLNNALVRNENAERYYNTI